MRGNAARNILNGPRQSASPGALRPHSTQDAAVRAQVFSGAGGHRLVSRTRRTDERRETETLGLCKTMEPTPPRRGNRIGRLKSLSCTCTTQVWAPLFQAKSLTAC
jgi:hypothetical protein